MTTVTHNYEVLDMAGFRKNLNRIVKRYKVNVNVIEGIPTDYKVHVDHHYDDFNITLKKTPVTVEFDFDEFKIPGYTYLGCIKDELMMGLITIHGNKLLDGRDINDFVKSFDSIPCHNCNRKHRRKVGHLFLHDDSGDILIFGSACAKNFFGVNFDRILKFFERVNITFPSDWEGEYIRDTSWKIIDWKGVARLAYFWISKYGYMSKSKAREKYEETGEPDTSTADWVNNLYYHYSDTLWKEILSEYKALTFPDFDILFTKNYVRDSENPTDFEYNLLVLQDKMKDDCVTFHDFGWICFMVYNEFFKSEEKPTRKEYIIPDWATPKRRIKKGENEVHVTVTNIHEFNGSFGLTYIYTFEWDNIRFKWFTSNNQNVNIGDEVILNGFTVKDTEDNQYGKSIIITRVILEDLNGNPTRTVQGGSRNTRSYVSKADKEYFERMGINTK